MHGAQHHRPHNNTGHDSIYTQQNYKNLEFNVYYSKILALIFIYTEGNFWRKIWACVIGMDHALCYTI